MEAEEAEEEEEENSSDKIKQPSSGRWGKNTKEYLVTLRWHEQ